MEKIYSKSQMKDFLNEEIRGKSLFSLYLNQQYTYIYIYYLRHLEFHYNKWMSNHRSLYHGFLYLYYHFFWRRWSLKTGITVPKNVCGKGLTLMHWGSIVVNSACRIGRNCCFINNINIGANGGSSKAPIIGDNVYIGPGAVLFGDISIADGCYIGANAVVNKSCDEPNSILIGVPAKVVRIEPMCWWEKNKWKRDKN